MDAVPVVPYGVVVNGVVPRRGKVNAIEVVREGTIVEDDVVA